MRVCCWVLLLSAPQPGVIEAEQWGDELVGSRGTNSLCPKGSFLRIYIYLIRNKQRGIWNVLSACERKILQVGGSKGKGLLVWSNLTTQLIVADNPCDITAHGTSHDLICDFVNSGPQQLRQVHTGICCTHMGYFQSKPTQHCLVQQVINTAISWRHCTEQDFELYNGCCWQEDTTDAHS